jgi:hypothetical protein
LKSEGSLGKRRIVIRKILFYLIKHPDAKDTIDGILKWWVPDIHRGWREEEVRQALGFLTSKGWLTARKIAASQKVYGLNKDKLLEIKEYLENS